MTFWKAQFHRIPWLLLMLVVESETSLQSWLRQVRFHLLSFFHTLSYEKNSTSEIKLALARIAKKFLTPPPTSTEVERLFSTAGDVLSNERNRLLPENLEKMLFCQENLPIINYKY